MTARKQQPDNLSALAVLDEPVRWALYRFVARQPEPVSREQAARAVGLSRAQAGFHLDKLAGEGLLETSFRRLTGRTGPGAGRPSKLYRRAERQVDVSVPPRRYEVAARILAAAVEESDSAAIRAALDQNARNQGRELGAEAKRRSGSSPASESALDRVKEGLDAHGYETRLEAGELRLTNCPFHGLIAQHQNLVCTMNRALIEGMLEELEAAGLEAALTPQTGLCCVTIRSREKTGP